MRLVYITPILIAAFLCAKVATGQKYSITVTIIGLHSDKGKVYLSLYHSPEGYPKKPSAAFRLSFASIVNGKAGIVLDYIPKGEYAIACYHDENNNSKMDTNLFGIPVEGTGASNNAKGSFGPPKFRDAKFIVDNDINQTIKIVY